MTVIDTRLGKIKGIDHGTSLAFLGIRYGKPPIGRLRFMPPLASGSWNGLLDATKYSNRAMQRQKLGTMGLVTPGDLSEDCLFLNIYTPHGENSKRPVMVWIHGGGFRSGSANEFDGRVLASQGDVVVVTINFRLGPFGFTDLDSLSDELTGTASNGYRDMILALEWVQKNISDYGGDSNNVTVFGQSTGGLGVLGLLAAPAAEGLFHKAIIHSANGPRWPGGDQTPKIAEKLGVGTSELLDTLRSMSAEEIIKAELPAGLCIDGTVLTCPLNESVRHARNKSIPIIIGTNRTEGTQQTPPDSKDEDLDVYEKRLTNLAKFVLESDDPTKYVSGLKSAYPDLNSKRRYEMLMTDSFRRLAISFIDSASESNHDCWLYRFDLETTIEHNGKLGGATHSGEMAFTFNAFADPGCHVAKIYDKKLPEVTQLAEAWSSTLTKFAWTGNPNDAGLLPHWPNYNIADRTVMHLTKNSYVSNDPDAVHRQLWDS
ncbi:MAG: carboxylesterase/lipase family protein [Gammaproteobacteria bacterium TMED1]|nr:MAG: carboxylesterase/lipase family protein [Gammaproteobacteria bacterium TMED1]